MMMMTMMMMADKAGIGGSSIGLISGNIHKAEGGLFSLFGGSEVCHVSLSEYIMTETVISGIAEP